MRLATIDIGDGPKRAALLHGLGGDRGTWFGFAPWLAQQGYTVTLVDQTGHGLSPRSEDYSTEALARDVIDTLPTGLDVVIGHSLGGRVLTLAAERLRPSLAIFLDPGWVVPETLAMELPRNNDGSLLSPEQLAEMLPDLPNQMTRRMHAAMERFDERHLQPPNFPLPPVLPNDVPAVASLIIVPDPSDYVPTHLQKQLTEAGYTVISIPGVTHELPALHLRELSTVLQDWL